MAFLTDRTFTSGVTRDSLVHIVVTGDTSQNPDGSSYKATLGQIIDLYTGSTDVFVTGGTYSNGTLILTNNTGGTINISGFYTGGTDVFVTGGTYNNNTGTATFTNNTGGTFNVTGFYTGGTDVFVTGFTYGQNTLNIQQNNNSVYSVTINEMTGLTINGNLLVTGNTHLESTTASTLNISTTPTTDTSTTPSFLTRDSSTGEVKIKQIPGPTVYGLFAQTGNSSTVSATTVESTIIDGGVGTLTVPANGFSIGDSFTATLAGLISVKPGGDTLRLRIKSGSVVLSDTGVISIASVTNDVWQININFTIRKIGGSGTASIVTLGNLHVIKTASGTPYSFAFNTVNNTTFDTTASNTLDITVQWGSNNVANSIYSDVFILNKTY
jgi:hypothetical protein